MLGLILQRAYLKCSLLNIYKLRIFKFISIFFLSSLKEDGLKGTILAISQ